MSVCVRRLPSLTQHRRSANSTQLQGFHPIHIAAWQGHTNVVDLLMGRRGVTVFALTKDLLTLEDVAASRGHNAVVELLVEFETEAALSRSDIMRQLLTKVRPPASFVVPRHRAGANDECGLCGRGSRVRGHRTWQRHAGHGSRGPGIAAPRVQC